MLQVIPFTSLQLTDSVWQFEGDKFENTDVAFIILDTASGQGPRLHTHPYKEVFIVLEGAAMFTVDKKETLVTGGNIVIVPSDTPHKFISIGKTKLKQIGIHLNKKNITNWLE